MGIFRRKVPNHFVPIHRQNALSKDWIILLEASTIVGPSPDRLRIARATLDRKVVKKYNIFLNARYYLEVDGYNPRIHALYFCPQLYRYDADKRLVPLQGEEIGKVIAQSLESGVSERRPWYQPADKLPDEPVIDAADPTEFDTVVVEMPSARTAIAKPSTRSLSYDSGETPGGR
jgi:hypothetical protein